MHIQPDSKPLVGLDAAPATLEDVWPARHHCSRGFPLEYALVSPPSFSVAATFGVMTYGWVQMRRGMAQRDAEQVEKVTRLHEIHTLNLSDARMKNWCRMMKKCRFVS